MASPRPLLHLPRCTLGEGPVWDGETQTLTWVDIPGHTIHRWTPGDDRCETHDTGRLVGFALTDRRGRLIAGLHDTICEMCFGAADTRVLARPDMHPENRFNDAACDPRGRLWVGTMHVEASRDKAPTGGLYRRGANGLDLVEADIAISNGIGWSPDGSIMYFSDTHRGTVFAYAYDLETGRAGDRRVFAQVPIEIGVPDGLTVDSAGRVHVCVWRGARINVYAATGALDQVIAMPVANPTSCCFGGRDLRTLYVTTAAAEGDPLSGRLFAMDVGIAGLPSARLEPWD